VRIAAESFDDGPVSRCRAQASNPGALNSGTERTWIGADSLGLSGMYWNARRAASNSRSAPAAAAVCASPKDNASLTNARARPRYR
jgi:hypothetical protein